MKKLAHTPHGACALLLRGAEREPSPKRGFLILKSLAEAHEPGMVSALAERARRAESQFFAGKIDDVLFKMRDPSNPSLQLNTYYANLCSTMKPDCPDLDWSKSFMYSIHQTYFLVQKRLEHKLHDVKGISFSQFLILLGLHCNEHTSQRAIADFLYLTEATVSRHITQLEKAKYLTRKEDPVNRRKHILTMTPKGASAFAEAHTIIERELREIFTMIPTSDRALITNAFDGVITKLNHKS